jgi:hypothetical protein
MQPDWQQLILAFRKSNQTHLEFCKAQKIPVSTFQYHLYKKHSVSANKANSFVRLMPLPERQNNLAKIELHFGNGRCLKLPTDYPVNSLRLLLKMAVHA